MLKLKLQAVLLLAILLLANIAHAQNDHVLSASIANAHKQGTSFRDVFLFAVTAGESHKKVVAEETLFTPLTQQVATLYNNKPAAVSMKINTASGKQYVLELLQFDPLATDANFGYINVAGRHSASFDRGLHYQGAIAGVTNSLACLSVFASGDVMLVFANDEGNFVLGKLDDHSGNYILYNDRDIYNRPYKPCAVKEKNISDNITAAQKSTTAYACHKVQLYWEADFELFTNKGSVSAVQTYLTGLFALVQTLYKNEHVAVELKSLYVWTTADPYPASGSSIALNTFTGTWNIAGDTFDGDVAHLITMDVPDNGGVGYVDILCNRPFAYAYSDIDGFYNTLPTYSWDVEVVTHETGHNLGSNHTHWCGWNTGVGGTCGAIDNCTTLEPGSSCNTCPVTFDNAAPISSWKGTIMSYCDLISRGTSFANGFGPLPSAQIRKQITVASCLKSIISASLIATPVCKFDGSISVAFNSNNVGAAPFTYYWSNNTHNQNLTNLNTPGNYSVFITDSNGCNITYNATVDRGTAPDCYPAGIGGVANTLASLQLYPNPADKTATIQFLAITGGNASIRVTDMLGRVAYSANTSIQVGTNYHHLNLYGWAKGVYTVCFDLGNGERRNLKLVVQ